MNIKTMRKRLEAQGFFGLTDAEVSEFNYPLRLAPAICLAWTALGVVQASPTVLGAMVPFALAGALLSGHPFDVLYNHGIRHLTGGAKLPEYGQPRRFACGMATGMISATTAAFYIEVPVLGYILGSVMLVMASSNVLTGFCVPSLIYRTLFGRPTPVADYRRT